MIFSGRHRSSSAGSERDRASREQANRDSWLLRLPAELRNHIYDLATLHGRNLGICGTRDLIEQCPLLAVCRQTQREVVPIFFGTNTFMILLRSLAKRSHHWRSKNRQPSFTEYAFASLRKYMLINNYTCKIGRQRLPHCLHLDGVVVSVDRDREVVEVCAPICSSGISLPGNASPQPFASSDDHPCFSACCLKSRKEAEERLVKEIQAARLQIRNRELARQDMVEVARQCYEYG